VNRAAGAHEHDRRARRECPAAAGAAAAIPGSARPSWRLRYGLGLSLRRPGELRRELPGQVSGLIV
jgi:hypothetical protein